MGPHARCRDCSPAAQRTRSPRQAGGPAVAVRQQSRGRLGPRRRCQRGLLLPRTATLGVAGGGPACEGPTTLARDVRGLPRWRGGGGAVVTPRGVNRLFARARVHSACPLCWGVHRQWLRGSGARAAMGRSAGGYNSEEEAGPAQRSCWQPEVNWVGAGAGLGGPGRPGWLGCSCMSGCSGGPRRLVRPAEAALACRQQLGGAWRPPWAATSSPHRASES